MKILVVGGTGLIGKDVSRKLTEADHEVIIGSPSNGVDVVSGEGFAEALDGTDVVIDLSNSASPDDETALNFFRTAGKNLAASEKKAGVKHHLILWFWIRNQPAHFLTADYPPNCRSARGHVKQLFPTTS